MMKTIAAISLLLLTHAGCGGGNDLSKEETQKAMVSVASAMSTGMAEVDTATESMGGSEASVNATANCLSGGTISTSGSVTIDAESFAFEMNIDLDACATGNIVADGGLRFAGGLDDTGFDFVMAGSFSFSGEISGSCDIEVNASVDNTGAAVMAGSICGFDAAEMQTL